MLPLQAGLPAQPIVFSAFIEINSIPISSARAAYRLPQEWIDRLEAIPQSKRTVLQVLRAMKPGPAHGIIRPSDLLLEVDGQVCGRARQATRCIHNAAVRRSGIGMMVPSPIDSELESSARAVGGGEEGGEDAHEAEAGADEAVEAAAEDGAA